MTIAIYDNGYTCWNGCPTDAGDKSSSLRSLLADTNGIGFARNTLVGDTGSKVEERIFTLSGIGVRIASVRWWVYCSSRQRKREAGQRQRDEKETAPQKRPAA